MLYFISDLDSTLIHSRNPKEYCVEYSEKGKEITYMKKSDFDSFEELLSSYDFCFIPCTMRSIEQTKRISFIQEHKPKFMICDNGASIYKNGLLDKKWDDFINGYIDKHFIRSCEKSLIKHYKKCKDITTLKTNRDCFISVFFKDIQTAEKEIDYLQNTFCKDVDLEVHVQGRKVYLVPSKLDKSLAVKYLMDRYHIDSNNVITAGDSSTDVSFINLGGCRLVPFFAFIKPREPFIYCGDNRFKPIDAVTFILLQIRFLHESQNSFMENLCTEAGVVLKK